MHKLVEVYKDNGAYAAVCKCGWKSRKPHADAAAAAAAHAKHAAK